MANGLRDMRLPADLCGRAEEQFGARFGSVEQFLTFVLQELLRDDATRLDQTELRIIEERLKDLGYI